MSDTKKGPTPYVHWRRAMQRAAVRIAEATDGDGLETMSANLVEAVNDWRELSLQRPYGESVIGPVRPASK